MSKTVLINPYENVDWESRNQYKANLHTHTRYSDGLSDPHQAIDEYHGADYDILALTDHDTHFYDERTATLWPWTELADIYNAIKNLTSPRWEETWEDASNEPWENRDPVVLGMLAVEGCEVSATRHIGSLFNSWAGEKTSNESYAFAQVENAGGIAMFYHPGRYVAHNNQSEINWYANFYRNFGNILLGIEVYNQGDRYANDRKFWDNLVKELYKDIDIGNPEKVKIFGYSNDDNHSAPGGAHYFRNYQYILADSLTESDVKTAMQEGELYFCYEPGGSGEGKCPKINAITVENGEINIDAEDYITINWEQGEICERKLRFVIYDFVIKHMRAVIENIHGSTYTQHFIVREVKMLELPFTGDFKYQDNFNFMEAI